MRILSFLSPLCFSHLSFAFGVFGVIQNHPIIPSPNHFSPPVTLLPAFASHLIALLCGWVWLCVFPPPPPLPFLVKERMRLEREEATRLLEEETEVSLS